MHLPMSSSRCCSLLVTLGLMLCFSACSDTSVVVDESVRAGRQVYEQLDCASCHGVQLEGKRSAPPLEGLTQYWTEQQLVRYLADPASVVKETPRLAYRLEQYPIAMPGYADAGDEALRELARYLLSE